MYEGLFDGISMDSGTNLSSVWSDSPGNYAASVTPAQVTPGATSWADVLKYGVSRWADYKIATIAPQNTTPAIAPTQVPQVQLTGAVGDQAAVRIAGLGGISLPMLLLIGAGLYFALK